MAVQQRSGFIDIGQVYLWNNDVIEAISIGAIAADFVLQKMLASSRYSHVICLCADKPLKHFHHLKTQHPRLQILSTCDDNCNTLSRNDRLLLKLREVESLLANYLAATPSNGHMESTAVVVHSLSEIALVLGHECALQWLLSLHKQLLKHREKNTPTASIKPSNTTTTVAGGNDGNSSACAAIVVVLHSTLHTEQFYRQVQRLCTSTSTILPNTGAYDDSVHCIAKTERRSPHSGRVQEAVELFHMRYHNSSGSDSTNGSGGATGQVWSELVCMRGHALEAGGVSGRSVGAESGLSVDMECVENDSVDRPNTSTQAVSTLGATAAKTLGGQTTQQPKSPLVRDSTRGLDDHPSEEERQQELMSGSGTAVGVLKQLVLFDRTDPEFDEDSDPDGDLDM